MGIKMTEIARQIFLTSWKTSKIENEDSACQILKAYFRNLRFSAIFTTIQKLCELGQYGYQNDGNCKANLSNVVKILGNQKIFMKKSIFKKKHFFKNFIFSSVFLFF
ncbi:hypothetical protein B9Z55_008574 [Caenorhabditis nigoni]|uniref:Uncharacterized protein n=1 Tax=Caenorhabditis nigoni TaxID=1611254 RepID=A0A2G5UP45_9PELO|nr:hypothetical protein B9Z55_008574 [Caenorhabditis nigoni]